MKNVCVVGGGPAGMMAAYAAGLEGHKVWLFEKNEKLGKKLFLTGKGRCNITNSADISDFFDNVVTNSNFLYSAFYTFTNTQLIQMFSEFGLETKTERGGRIFPVSDKSSDVIVTLRKAMGSVGVRVSLRANVERVLIKDGNAAGIVWNGEKVMCDSVIVAAGGLSYPLTGSTGDGYDFAKNAGHRIVRTQPSLVAMDTAQDVSGLAGLTLRNISFSLIQGGKRLYKQQGELLFTHKGISGPLTLSASAYMKDKKSKVSLDLKPALEAKTLDARLQRDFEEKSNKDFVNVLGGLLPSRLIPFMISRVGIDAEKKAHSITRQERAQIVKTLKSFDFDIKRTRPIEEAIITRGGVDVAGVDASTMQSKLCPNLYFAGEVIDVDALTGGYNLQIAFSTGYLAGISC